MTAGDHGKHEKCVQNFDRKTLRERNNWKTQTQMDNIKIEFVETNRGLVNLGIPYRQRIYLLVKRPLASQYGLSYM